MCHYNTHLPISPTETQIEPIIWHPTGIIGTTYLWFASRSISFFFLPIDPLHLHLASNHHPQESDIFSFIFPAVIFPSEHQQDDDSIGPWRNRAPAAFKAEAWAGSKISNVVKEGPAFHPGDSHWAPVFAYKFTPVVAIVWVCIYFGLLLQIKSMLYFDWFPFLKIGNDDHGWRKGSSSKQNYTLPLHRTIIEFQILRLKRTTMTTHFRKRLNLLCCRGRPPPLPLPISSCFGHERHMSLLQITTGGLPADSVLAQIITWALSEKGLFFKRFSTLKTNISLVIVCHLEN